jgi:UDP-glucose:(heptosyl)LPS alpha-1,3-glucosyltransferase
MKRAILLKTRAKQRGGLEKMATRIQEGLIQRGHEVFVFANELSSSWLPSRRIEEFDRQARAYVTSHPADIVFGLDRTRFQTHLRAGNGVHAAYLDSRTKVEGRWKRFCCTWNPLHRKILEIEKTAFEYPGLQKLFVNSSWVKRQVLERYRVDPAKIEVFHNGVEWLEMESDFNRSLEQKRDAYCFLFIGNGYLRKGLDPLLEALAVIERRDFRLIVAGKEKRIDDYRRKAVELGLENKVCFLGPVADVRPLYAQADALMIPSFYDPFANVTVEALAMGLFVLSSRSNGGSEILSAENGIIVEDLFSKNAMVAAILSAMDHPKTADSAQRIRAGIAHLDFSHQLGKLLDACL